MGETPVMADDEPFVRVVPFLEPDDPIVGTDSTVGGFWRWAMSDLVSNDTRGVFAEYLVATALDAATGPRPLWVAWDLDYGPHRIEVKATGDVQAWKPARRPASPGFDIAAKRGWDSTTNLFADEPGRAADVYVFCHWRGTEADARHVADAQRWDFYVLATSDLTEACPLTQKRIGLNALRPLCEDGPGRAVGYAGLRQAVDEVVGPGPTARHA